MAIDKCAVVESFYVPTPTSTTPYAPADRWLERALLFDFSIHGVALGSTALLLLPMLPGGSEASDLARMELIANHPWRFRLGWLPWQLCALADVWLAIAMVRVRWLPRAGAWLVLLLTILAVLPDQYAQAVWVTRGVTLAKQGAALHDATQYLTLERGLFLLTAGYGALFYTLAGLGWTACFASAGTWSTWLTGLSVPLWSCMAVAVVSPLLPHARQPSSAFIALANAAAFLQLPLWLGLVTEQVLRRFRPFETHGRLARWRHPGEGPLARAADLIANSRLFASLLGRLPPLPMKSDIRDAVYVNYLLPAERLEPLVPEGLELQRLGPQGQYALFTFLTYRHGHFGPAFSEALRRLFPSSVQTNWRIHVRDPEMKREGVYFVTSAVTHLVHAFGARLLADGMPMHPLQHASVKRCSDRTLDVSLRPGAGSAPDATLHLRELDAAPILEGPWAECWPDFRAFLAYCVPQDRALSSQPLQRRVTRQEIDLGIPIDACSPLDGSVSSRAAERIAGDAKPLCFHVANVDFYFSGEHHDYH